MIIFLTIAFANFEFVWHQIQDEIQTTIQISHYFKNLFESYSQKAFVADNGGKITLRGLERVLLISTMIPSSNNRALISSINLRKRKKIRGNLIQPSHLNPHIRTQKYPN
jgi:hypothetical protein